MSRIKTALISVSDKSKIEDFARGLRELGVEIISTGGTAALLRAAGVTVKDVSELTGFPEMLDGRVKTLHPFVHAGLLARRSDAGHRKALQEHGISPIDLVVVNLYPFERTIASPGVSFEQVIENIDIGGPTMLRSAAKNFADVTVLVDPGDYEWVLSRLRAGQGALTPEERFTLARKVFQHTADYDAVIADYLSGVCLREDTFSPPRDKFTASLHLSLSKVQDLRYGENPHQKAAFYRCKGEAGLPQMEQLHGKELSFNNILDIEAAFRIARDFEDPVAVVIKHTNPCGVAVGASLAEAYINARETDPVSAFGSVLGFNRPLDSETAVEIISTFVEAVIAPDFDQEALKVLRTKQNLRLLRLQAPPERGGSWDIKRVAGGVLIQEWDSKALDWSDCRVLSKREPSESEWRALRFAWRVVKHVKSNAIVYANERQTLGIGAGQMSRVDSSRLAVSKARSSLRGSVLASDAFFPFRDGVDAAAEAGASAIIQPGGSVRDKEVIQAADEHGMAMVFTGMRHFKH